MNGEKTDFFALTIEVIDDFFNRFTHGAHGNDQPLSIRSTVIIEEMIFTAGNFRNFGHVSFDNVGQFLPVAIGHFALLEIDIRVLHRAFEHRMVRVEAAAAERVDGIAVKQTCQRVIVHDFNLLHFVRCAETVKEVQERNTAFDS